MSAYSAAEDHSTLDRAVQRDMIEVAEVNESTRLTGLAIAYEGQLLHCSMFASSWTGGSGSRAWDAFPSDCANEANSCPKTGV